MKRYLSRACLAIVLLMSKLGFAQLSPFIHVDQFGYITSAEKVAVLSNPEVGYNGADVYTSGNTIELRDFNDNTAIFSGPPQLWNNGATHSQSGDAGWWFDFTSVNTPGTFYVYDPTNNASSAPFEINDNPYQAVLQAAVRMLYYNRCNADKSVPFAQSPWVDGQNFMHPLQDANCRYIYDPSNAALEKDLSGGWFDAGDYNKYVTFAHTPIHELLGAFTDNPGIFGDDWNWPESGNGLPDLLDEVKWELDWLLKMQNPDGSVIIKMGSQNYNDNTSSPPSANTDQRFYGPTCTSASVASAGMFAHAAKVYAGQPGMQAYTQSLQSAAILSWNYWKSRYDSSTLETDCDDGSIVAGDADLDEPSQKKYGLIAATYLFDLTGEVEYENYINTELSQNEPISNGFWSPYEVSLSEALLNYATLPNSNTTNSNTIITSASAAVNNDWNAFYAFSDADLYRAESPDWMYHWGSNLPKAGMANLCIVMDKYDVVPSASDQLQQKIAEQTHYFHGVNPLGLVLLSNMYQYGGDRCVNEIYHTWFYDGTDFDNALSSLYGPAPGFVTGGPNQNYTISSITPPAGQPIMKSYLDFNDGFPNNSWEISEPAIYYQANYIRMLANGVNTSLVTANMNLSLMNQCVEIYPNPSNTYFKLTGLLANYQIEILDESGATYQTLLSTSSDLVIDIPSLPVGMFFVRATSVSNGEVFVQKLIKTD